ncbi:MAG TPA: ribonuclease HII [Bacteroidetes bacterium]|nr:ribonuclease HII [Bacteroidota bacterium]
MPIFILISQNLPYLPGDVPFENKQGKNREHFVKRVVSAADILKKYEYERKLWQEGIDIVAGVDEAGRGPLAGPVVAAAVILPQAIPTELPVTIDDSKKLTQKRRETAFKWITTYAQSYGVAIVTPQEIDSINIRQAAMLAMRRAVQQLEPQPSHVLIDGLPIEQPPCTQTAIVKGDSKSMSIAAASIIAKVVRDRIMLDYDASYPQYGFASNMGYPTKAHIQAIAEHGLSPIHRKSFRPKQLQQQGLFD